MRNTCYISLFNPYSNGADNTQVKPCVTNLNSLQSDIYMYIFFLLLCRTGNILYDTYIFAVALFSFSFRVPLPPTVLSDSMLGPICLSPSFFQIGLPFCAHCLKPWTRAYLLLPPTDCGPLRRPRHSRCSLATCTCLHKYHFIG